MNHIPSSSSAPGQELLVHFVVLPYRRCTRLSPSSLKSPSSPLLTLVSKIGLLNSYQTSFAPVNSTPILFLLRNVIPLSPVRSLSQTPLYHPRPRPPRQSLCKLGIGGGRRGRSGTTQEGYDLRSEHICKPQILGDCDCGRVHCEYWYTPSIQFVTFSTKMI